MPDSPLVRFLIAFFLSKLTSSAQTDKESSLRLEFGSAPGTGSVLVLRNGKWGSVCDDAWALSAATVVCRQLGFPTALGFTRKSYFGVPSHDIALDNVQCHGSETNILSCQHSGWGVHDCGSDEAAGVFCAPIGSVRTSTVADSRSSGGPNNPFPAAATLAPRPEWRTSGRTFPPHQPPTNNLVQRYFRIRLSGGRNLNEGRVEVNLGGFHSPWETVCSNSWTLLEANVACRELGLGFARDAIKTSYFGGEGQKKVISGLHCSGAEEKLTNCRADPPEATRCDRKDMVAGVACTERLPDLVLNETLLEASAYLQDRPLYHMQCALDERCAASSAFRIMDTDINWHVQRRRLLRFSSSTWNFGTADFRPTRSKREWQYHTCHMHYHSMEVFAHYDLLDLRGHRVAEGHKASFCLEDVRCADGVRSKFSCRGHGDQGISVGCADDYLHDIDCQWIDITDVEPGSYVFKVHVNPEYEVAETNFQNNAVTCQADYSGTTIALTDCLVDRK